MLIPYWNFVELHNHNEPNTSINISKENQDFYNRLISYITRNIIVTDDPSSKPDQNMLGGETGKITFGRINYNLRLGVKKFCFVYNILVQCAGADCRVIGVTFMTVFIVRRDAACS